MGTSALQKEMTRFATRLPKEQKLFLEKAARLAGFSSLSAFILQTAQDRANEIIREHETTLGSEQDREVFIEALMDPAEPNGALKDAAVRYQNICE